MATDPNLIDNERTKLFAGALDRASTAVFTVGFLTPAVSYWFDFQQIRGTLGLGGLAGFIVLSLAVMVALHLLGRRVLGALK